MESRFYVLGGGRKTGICPARCRFRGMQGWELGDCARVKLSFGLSLKAIKAAQSSSCWVGIKIQHYPIRPACHPPGSRSRTSNFFLRLQCDSGQLSTDAADSRFQAENNLSMKVGWSEQLLFVEMIQRARLQSPLANCLIYGQPGHSF